MLLKIESWFGRLGNNIIQLKNAISVGVYYGYNVVIPKHQYFNKTFIKINKNDNKQSKMFIDRQGSNFFYSNRISVFNKEAFEINQDKVKKILIELFIINSTTLEPLGKNDVVIHIRSGDIFVTPHPRYVPSPLSYYTEIIDDNKFENIYIIAENKNNPCIDKLLQLYPQIYFKMSSLHDDIKLLLKAQNIICSVGTLVPTMMYFTDNVKNIHFTSWDFTEYLPASLNCNIIKHDCQSYKSKVSAWKNTKEQIQAMLND